MCEPSTIAMTTMVLGAGAIQQRRQEREMKSQQREAEERMKKYRAAQRRRESEGTGPGALKMRPDMEDETLRQRGMGVRGLTIPLGGGEGGQTGVRVPQ